VEELLMSPSQKVVYSAGNGEVEVYEIIVPELGNDRTMGDLFDPLEQCYPVALSRAGRSFLPSKDTILQSGDLLNVSTTFEGIGALTARLAKKAEA